MAVSGYLLTFPQRADALWNSITNAAEDESITSRTADYAQVSQTFREFPPKTPESDN